MKVAAVTITYNRLELTKKTIESFYAKTNVDYHLFVDNGSTDGTKEWLLESRFDVSYFNQNTGITNAFIAAVEQLSDYDFILKLDNDIETVTNDIIAKMLKFYELAGMNYVVSPVDLLLDPSFAPPVLGRQMIKGYDVKYVSHTGGAFQLIPYSICKSLCKDFHHLKKGDYMIGKYYSRHGFRPAYLMNLEMKHIGLNQTSPNYVL